MASKPRRATLRATITVHYDLNGYSPDALKAIVARNIEHAVGNGVLSGPLVDVDEWRLDCTIESTP